MSEQYLVPFPNSWDKHARTSQSIDFSGKSSTIKALSYCLIERRYNFWLFFGSTPYPKRFANNIVKTRDSFRHSGWGSLLGEINKLLFGLITNGSFTSIDRNNGYDACDNQSRITIVPVTQWLLIFQRTLKIIENGGNE